MPEYHPWIAKTYSDQQGNSLPGVSVSQHCRNVGYMAKALLERIPDATRKMLPEGIVTLVACHDVGKISPDFQRMIWKHTSSGIPDKLCDELRGEGLGSYHETVSEAAITKHIGRHSWKTVIGKHHARYVSPKRDTDEIYGKALWSERRQALIQELISEFGPLPSSSDQPTDEQNDIATGFLVIADWIGSDEHFFTSVPHSPETKETLSQHAEEVLDGMGWYSPETIRDVGFHKLFGIHGDALPVQKAMEQAATQPGIYILEAPMGIGKTEAALLAAHKLISQNINQGIYFALPTRTTSDRIFERMEHFIQNGFIGDSRVRLLHGTAWMKRFTDFTEASSPRQESVMYAGGEEMSPGERWFHPAKRGLLQPFGVGTIDQSLMSVLNVRHHFLRLFGLTGKVVILDEVHSYDMYTGTLLDKLVETLEKTGTTVIILSATLTRQRREEILRIEEPSSRSDTPPEPYPLLTYRYTGGENIHTISDFPGVQISEHTVNLEHQIIDCRNRDFSQLARMAITSAEQGEIVLCIMNTVDAAQELYDHVKAASTAALPLERIGLLHSRFPLWKRDELEAYWLNTIGKHGDRSQGAVLVATQVVEQSVDIDADRMITELAPTDMLLQRLGRLWRHKRTDRTPAAKCRATILHPQFQNESDFADSLAANGYVYSPYILWRSHQEWKKRDFIRLPTDIREILEATYTENEIESEAIAELRKKQVKNCENMRKQATVYGNRNDFPEMKDQVSKTRYNDSPSLEILLLRSQPRHEGARTNIVLSDGTELVLIPYVKQVKNAIGLQRNMISVRMKPKDQALLEETLPEVLTQYFFKGEQIVSLIQSTDEENHGIGCALRTPCGTLSGFRYHPDRGIFRENASKNTIHPKNQISKPMDVIPWTDDDEMEECSEEFEW